MIQRVESTELLTWKSPMMTEAKLVQLWHWLYRSLELGIPGAIVELGCNEGSAAGWMARMLQVSDPKRDLHLFDSFEGMPAPGPEDQPCEILKVGDLKATPEALLRRIAEAGLPAPRIHAGWFRDTLGGLPDRIAFAHLDADFFQGTLEGLEALYPRMERGGAILLDDYCDPVRLDRWNRLPGVKRACDMFLRDKPERAQVLVCGHYAQGVLVKQ